MGDPKRRPIGFKQYDDEPEVPELKNIKNNPEENEEEIEETPTTVMLEDYIPGAVYDAQGNIVTYKSFNAAVKKLRAEARNLSWGALARLILYTSIGASIVLLSYGAYNKYLKPTPNKPKIERSR